MTGRRYVLSDEDKAVFRDAMRDARPLQKRDIVAIASTRHRNGFVSQPPHTNRYYAETRPAAGAITGHQEARLRRGRLDPQARLDLHGFSYESAYRALVAFLIRAQLEDRRLVLVITGKGGVLRSHLPAWLNGPDLHDIVVGLREAHPRHGGGGAFYVALYRHRPFGIR